MHSKKKSKCSFSLVFKIMCLYTDYFLLQISQFPENYCEIKINIFQFYKSHIYSLTNKLPDFLIFTDLYNLKQEKKL